MPSSYPSLPEPMLTRPILSLHTKPELVPLTKPHSLRSLSYLLRFRTHRISSDSAHTASHQIPHTPLRRATRRKSMLPKTFSSFEEVKVWFAAGKRVRVMSDEGFVSEECK